MMLGFLKQKTAPNFPPHWQDRVELRKSTRAKRVTLRADTTRHKIWLIHPSHGSIAHAVRFALENHDWIEKRLQEMRPRKTLGLDDTITIAGKPHAISLGTSSRVHIRGDKIFAGRDADLIVPRLRRFLKNEARALIEPLAIEKAKTLGVSIKSIRLSDPKTRWGSCSSTKTLSFSWRLILCPPGIIDYVVAHEVAHLKHMNHSKSFWACCQSLCVLDAATARSWFKTHGRDLHHVI